MDTATDDAVPLANTIAAHVVDTRDPMRVFHTHNRESGAYMTAAEPELADFARTVAARTFAELHRAPAEMDDGVLQEAMAAVERTCGDLRTRILHLVDAYTKKYKELCAAHAHCTHVMGEFRKLVNGLRDIPYIGMDTSTFAVFQTTMAEYVRHVHSDVLDVQGAYDAFQKRYAEWLCLRNTVLALHPFARGAPQCAALCTICTTESVQYAYVPCGHTFCRGCAHKHSGLCFVCRTPVEKTQQLFFL